MASAGTGKTWLLVTRLLRLLLEDTPPDAILAITFTRKAAAEMATRLMDRLYALSLMDPAERERALLEMGVKPTPSMLRAAAGLYEKYLFEPRQVRVTTFHAFCQELLRRFPLEADVPAGFEVLDAPRLIEEGAWDALVDEATRSPSNPVARDLDELFQSFKGHQGTKAALMQFLHHRSDWWAYTRDQTRPADYTYRILAGQLAVELGNDPLDAGLTESVIVDLQTYAELLLRHGTATLTQAASDIREALDPGRNSEDRVSSLAQALLKKSVIPKPSKALAKSLGDNGQNRLIDLHERLNTWLLAIQDQYRRRRTLVLSHAWFRTGTRLLDHYQRLKAEQRLLDFADLEWKSYLLLNHADHALWVQYKLDQRIDHLLIDEFQDTNPTQWHLLFPLLQELAAGENPRRRSVFLVGDTKQSIYRFRRAEPDLFSTARRWLHEHIHAVDHALSMSWRSSPAIIDFVNRIFSKGPLRAQFMEFSKHTTHRGGLWGQVEIMPLICDERSEATVLADWRNPLRRPREAVEDSRHRGEVIAARIQALLAQPAVIGEGTESRPIRYDDIMILVRHRTHAHAYEEALRAADIPYVTATRGTLLDCIEIGDMVALLHTLVTPYNNLNLATVLRSPLFDCSDADLMTLAGESGDYWLERLSALAPRLAAGTPLARAAYWLPRWQRLVGQRPVHDLLDRIYSEGNAVARYESALPRHLRSRVRANLTRFIELALEMDSGRYPSLAAFLQRLAALRAQEDDAPDEAAADAVEGSVRLLTIHAAKGLESPVIFLADSTTVSPHRRAHKAIVSWPAHADRPTHFLLCGKTGEVDSITAALLEDEARQEQREQSNLLYVAVTRAKQWLFISGCKPTRGDDLGWYGAIARQLGDEEVIQQSGWSSSESAPPPAVACTASVSPPIDVEPGLTVPVPATPAELEIAPSRTTADQTAIHGGEEGRERGLAIHRFIQLLSDEPQTDTMAIRQRVVVELALDTGKYPVDEWQAEAESIVNHADFREWFDPARYDRVFKEVPIYYYKDAKLVHGVIDRLVIKNDTCILIDFKTHRNATVDKLEAAAAPYQEQMRLYTEGVKALWPDKEVRSFLLFTASAGVYSWQPK